jgi:hypothetical protein
MLNEQDIFTNYTTLGDDFESAANKAVGSGAEMLDYHDINMQDHDKGLTGNCSLSDLMPIYAKNASNTLTIASTVKESNKLAVSYVANPIHAPSPSPVEHYTELASLAPSQISSY